MSDNKLGLDDEFMSTMLADFLDESAGYLSRLNENLLTLDDLIRSHSDPSEISIDVELLNEMFRDAHSLKGLSAMLQLDNINLLTHLVENVFDAARQGSLVLSREATDLIFEAVDCLASMVDQLRNGTDEVIEYKSISDRITEFLNRDGLATEALSQDKLNALLDDINEELADTPEAKQEEVTQPEENEAALPQPPSQPEGINDDPFADVKDESEVQGKYLAIFADESGESLDEVVELLITKEPKDVAPLLGLCHRIKGSAAAIGLNRAARLAHCMEDILQEVQGTLPLNPGLTCAMLQGVDTLRARFENLNQGSESEDNFLEVYRALQAARAECLADSSSQLSEAQANTTPAEQTAEAAPSAATVAEPPAAIPAAAAPSQPPQNTAAVKQAGEGAAVEGPANAATPKPPNTKAAAPPKGVTKGAAAGGSNDKPLETVRVDIERLDQLMNLAGQLVINKARFGQLGEKLKEISSQKQSQQCLQNISHTLNRLADEGNALGGEGPESAFVRSLLGAVHQIDRDLEIVQADLKRLRESRSQVNDLNEAVHQLDRIADGIQKSVMNTRMVPIGPLFNRFKRVIRDITRGNGREIQLVIRGEKTELDKRMIDELSDPLIHMVRNSADHGIEKPEDRELAGKPKTGTIELDAYHRGNRIIIEVKDDGKGLDPEKIKSKAISNGIITAHDADRLSEEQVYQLIWEPGFSTAEAVTEVSGRGMGMDIVRSRIEQLSGTVELSSVPGKGTTIAIKLPLTMAILPSLLTEISGEAYAIPVESVIEIVRVEAKDLATVHNMPTARVRGRVISVVELGQLLSWNDGHQRSSCTEKGCTLVIIGTDEKELGLAVDGLLGEEDIVIKSLAENYKNVHGLSGASILGDGRVSLILDVGALIEIACRKLMTHESDN